MIEDYHILQTTRDEYLIRAIRNGMDGAGVPVEFSKGEAGKGASTRSTSCYADALEMADRHVIYKNGAKEIAAQHGRDHVHGQVLVRRGRLVVPRALEPVVDRRPRRDVGCERARSPLGTVSAVGSVASSRARELAWMYAPTVNSYKRYQPESWAPTALAWSVDNRTCGFRVVGHGPSFRLESRIPGADVNPYLAFAATIAAGLHGIEHGLDPGPRFDGNAYAAEELARVPSTSRKRPTRSRARRSRSTRSAPTCTSTC